jgi:hypothetical protein
MRFARSSVVLIVLFTAFVSSTQATILQSWDLTNKTPGALGLDYGLRLNHLGNFLSRGDKLIFDFEHSSSSMMMSLVYVGGDLELRLSGTSFGAEFAKGPTYGSTYDGLYDINFTWVDVERNRGGFDIVAEFGNLKGHSKGADFGSVKGLSADTAFSDSQLNLFSFNGKYKDTLDLKYGRNPEASAWLTYDNGAIGETSGHAGYFGFSTTVKVPESATFSMLLLGLTGVIISRKKPGLSA